jgi:hypothetical protein
MTFEQLISQLHTIHPLNGKIILNYNEYFKFLYNTFSNQRTITLAYRQAGTSTFIACYMLHSAFIGQRSIVFSPNINSSKMIQNMVKNFYMDIQNNKPGCITLNNTEITFDNGGQILFAGSNVDPYVRGFDDDTNLFFNDAAFYNFDMNVINTFKNIHIISTPNQKRGTFYELWTKNYYSTNNDIWKCSKMVLEDLINLGINSDLINKLDYLRKTMSKESFNAEYCGIFKPSEEKSELIHIRIKEFEKIKIQEESDRMGFRSISEYARFKLLN